METVRMRITGDDNAARALIAILHGLPGIEYVEEVNDLMPFADDADSSSAGLPDDEGPGLHEIEVEAPDRIAAEHVREVADETADELGVTIEHVDEF